MLEREFASLAHLVPDKTLTSWFSILQHESFHCVGLFGEALGRGTGFSLFLCNHIYCGQREVPAKTVLFTMGLSSHCVVTAGLGDRFWFYCKESEIFFKKLEYSSSFKQFKASSWKKICPRLCFAADLSATVPAFTVTSAHGFVTYVYDLTGRAVWNGWPCSLLQKLN